MPPSISASDEVASPSKTAKPTTVPDTGMLTPASTSTPEPWSPSSVLSTVPAHSVPAPHTSSPVPFFHLLTRLKSTKREGWRRFGIDRGESIADHMYRMSLITMLAPSALASRLDVPRCTKMALIHDMAESLVGDITPIDGVPKIEKNRREATTMDYLCRDLLGAFEGGERGRELRAIWEEYEENQTLEAKFVHDVDKIELILQMVEYEKQYEATIDLGEFSWVAQRIVLPEVDAWCKEVLRDREEYWKSVGKIPNGSRMSVDREKLQLEYYGNGSAEAAANGHKDEKLQGFSA